MIRRGLQVVVLMLSACAAPGAVADDPGAVEAGDTSRASHAAADVGAASEDSSGGATPNLSDPEQPSAPDALPSGRRLPPISVRPESLVAADLFGPAPGTSPAEYDAWVALLVERFYGQPDEQRAASIARELSAVHVVDLTPVYIDLTVGLDLALEADVAVAAGLVSDWYVRQLRYKQVILPASQTADAASMVSSRLLVLDAWHRWWERTVNDPERVQRFRGRIDDLLWELGRVGRDPALR